LVVPVKILFWLSVLDRSAGMYGSTGDLWRREITTGMVPAIGDRIYCWPTDEDGDCGGLRLAARTRCMGASGQWHVELSRLHIDPTEQTVDAIRTLIVNGRPYDAEIWSAVDGPVEALNTHLAAAGWVKQ
jgi:hypothetical protein